jgi:colicin import membrane protein
MGKKPQAQKKASPANGQPGNYTGQLALQQPAVISATRDWLPLEQESDGQRTRSFVFAVLLHLSLIGLMYVGFENVELPAQELAGEPIEVIMTGDLAKTKLSVLSTVARVPTRVPKVEVQRAPRSDVTDLRQTPPPIEIPDPAAIEERELEERQKEEQARSQQALDELMRAQQQKDDDIKQERDRLIAAQEAAELARIKAQVDQEEETALQGTSSTDNLLAMYVSALHGQIKQASRVPIALGPGERCDIFIKQTIGGEVVDAYPQGTCNVSVDIQNQLIESIRRASPLPYESFQSVFSENLILPFTGN